MGIIESHEPLAVRPMQREPVVNAVRLFRRGRYPRHREADPMPTRWVNHENLPVEVKEHIEGRVTRLRHSMLLSY
jgi:hypothetical protein